MNQLLQSVYGQKVQEEPQVVKQQEGQQQLQQQAAKSQKQQFIKQRYDYFFRDNDHSVDISLDPHNITTLDQYKFQNQQKEGENQQKKKLPFGGRPFIKKAPSQTQTQQISEKSKKIKKKPGQDWKPSFKLIDVSYPVEIQRPTGNEKSKEFGKNKRYYISLKYRDPEHPTKVYQKTIRFGKQGVKEAIDHSDNQMAEFQCSKYKYWDNPFCPNYWRILLLNTPDEKGQFDMGQAYQKYIQQLRTQNKKK